MEDGPPNESFAEYALHNALAFDGPKITRDDSRSETQIIRPGPVFGVPKAENCFETVRFKTIYQSHWIAQPSAPHKKLADIMSQNLRKRIRSEMDLLHINDFWRCSDSDTVVYARDRASNEIGRNTQNDNLSTRTILSPPSKKKTPAWNEAPMQADCVSTVSQRIDINSRTATADAKIFSDPTFYVRRHLARATDI